MIKTKLARVLKHKRVQQLSKWSKPRQLWGVPVRVHSSVVLLVGLVLCLHGPWPVVCLAVGLMLHEYAHIWKAQSLGIKTERVDVTGLGAVANMESKAFERFLHEGDCELQIGAAGPLMSFSLASLGFIGGTVMVVCGLPSVGVALGKFGWINVMLGGFNMLPVFPMDGGRVLRGFLHKHFFKTLNDKEVLNEFLLDCSKIPVYFVRSAGVALCLLWPPFLIFVATSKLGKTEALYIKNIIEQEKRRREYVPDAQRQSWCWWFDLGLRQKPTSFSEVKQAYRKQVLQVHPDRGGSSNAMHRTLQAYKMAQQAFGVS